MKKAGYYFFALVSLLAFLAAIVLAEGYGQRIEGIDAWHGFAAFGVFAISLYGMNKLQEGEE